jgi:hypothetical protein
MCSVQISCRIGINIGFELAAEKFHRFLSKNFLSLSINGKDKLRVLHSSIPSIIDDLRKIITDWEGEIMSEVGPFEFWDELPQKESQESKRVDTYVCIVNRCSIDPRWCSSSRAIQIIYK